MDGREKACWIDRNEYEKLHRSGRVVEDPDIEEVVNDGEMRNRNDWWLDGEESHTKDRTERTATDAKGTSEFAGKAPDLKETLKSAGEATDATATSKSIDDDERELGFRTSSES
ncbi:hypothetical protein PPTG_23327 [Phytophthora nicotianae INRA-310]|uniref:Uncharacterized protein n=1 Tax=Phytophthora nicotianae (strain INRA-310) TaxID=761204 RepID=W2Q157_PHYN3|nr:hypothetical protein PPTG_23327 [Phytophthora nicotianae INRA-310]ETN06631.1 hypothetical protein PPTG_23327 [Phytophthora nicotianae INRA-310]